MTGQLETWRLLETTCHHPCREVLPALSLAKALKIGRYGGGGNWPNRLCSPGRLEAHSTTVTCLLYTPVTAGFFLFVFFLSLCWSNSSSCPIKKRPYSGPGPLNPPCHCRWLWLQQCMPSMHWRTLQSRLHRGKPGGQTANFARSAQQRYLSDTANATSATASPVLTTTSSSTTCGGKRHKTPFAGSLGAMITTITHLAYLPTAH